MWYRDGTTRDKVAKRGFPQWSPLTPLLFLLYITILLQDENKNTKLGYTDDIAILSIGSTVFKAEAEAQQEVDKLDQLASENRIDFDPTKSELLVIEGWPKKKLDTSGLSFQIQGHSVITSSYLRWLGVWLESQLNLNQHVQEWCGKA